MCACAVTNAPLSHTQFPSPPPPPSFTTHFRCPYFSRSRCFWSGVSSSSSFSSSSPSGLTSPLPRSAHPLAIPFLLIECSFHPPRIQLSLLNSKLPSSRSPFCSLRTIGHLSSRPTSQQSTLSRGARWAWFVGVVTCELAPFFPGH